MGCLILLLQSFPFGINLRHDYEAGSVLKNAVEDLMIMMIYLIYCYLQTILFLDCSFFQKWSCLTLFMKIYSVSQEYMYVHLPLSLQRLHQSLCFVLQQNCNFLLFPFNKGQGSFRSLRSYWKIQTEFHCGLWNFRQNLKFQAKAKFSLVYRIL